MLSSSADLAYAPSRRKPLKKGRSLIWNYFTYDSNSNRSSCNVEGCDKSYAGSQNTCIFRTHLKDTHAELHNELVANELEKPYKTNNRNILNCMKQESPETLKPPIRTTYVNQQTANKYNVDSEEFLTRLDGVAMYLMTSALASLNTATEPHFQEMLLRFDPRFPVEELNSYHVQMAVDKIYSNIHSNINLHLEAASKISIVCDLWSKKTIGTYLGIAANFYSPITDNTEQVLLSLSKLRGPCKGDQIFNATMEVINEWRIAPKVWKFVTDNGSNMLKDFNKDARLANTDDEIEEDNHYFGPNILNECDEDVEHGDSSAAFEQCEEEFQNNFGSRRQTCSVHTIQLVACLIEKNVLFKETLMKANDLVASVAKSNYLVQCLYDLCNERLVKCCITRWSSAFLLLLRLLELRTAVEELSVMESLEQCLSASDWKTIETIVQFLHPFATHAELWKTEPKETPFSLVLVSLVDLEQHLLKYAENSIFADLATQMLDVFRRCFNKYRNDKANDFNPCYVIATFLDPHWKFLLDENQVDAAIKAIERYDISVEGSLSPDVQGTSIEEVDFGVSSPKISRFSAAETMLRKRFKLQQNSKYDSKSVLRSCLEVYANDQTYIEYEVDAMEYWKNVTECKAMKNFALNYLSIPASSASVKRLILRNGIAFSGSQNSSADSQLFEEAFVKVNSRFL